jgi:hypothetical protein
MRLKIFLTNRFTCHTLGNRENNDSVTEINGVATGLNLNVCRPATGRACLEMGMDVPLLNHVPEWYDFLQGRGRSLRLPVKVL